MKILEILIVMLTVVELSVLVVVNPYVAGILLIVSVILIVEWITYHRKQPTMATRK